MKNFFQMKAILKEMIRLNYNMKKHFTHQMATVNFSKFAILREELIINLSTIGNEKLL